MEDQEAMVVIVVDMAHHHMSMAHRRLMEELGQAAISTINRPTPNHCSNNNSKELQHTNKQAINHSMLNKHIRKPKFTTICTSRQRKEQELQANHSI